MAAFAQFGSDLDKATQRQLARGERLLEILKQGQFVPLPVGLQIVSMYAGTKGYMDNLKVSAIGAFEPHMHRFVETEGADLLETIASTGKLDDEIGDKLGALIQKAADLFLKEHPEASVA
jgi:F-type H+-transporting ATPase subunit alpha